VLALPTWRRARFVLVVHLMERSYWWSEHAMTLAPVDLEVLRARRSWFIGLGLALVILGALAIILPFAASLVTTLVLGFLLVTGGLVQGYHAIQNRHWGGSGWAIVGALVYIVAGVLVIAFPLAGTVTLTVIIASYLVAMGILKIVRAIQHREMPAWGWLAFDGVLSLFLGGLIWLWWPGTAVWTIGLLVGIELVFSGSSMLVLGLASRPLVRA
jgi:uncharacterized membrane protein HdeD (DUF308 family)